MVAINRELRRVQDHLETKSNLLRIYTSFQDIENNNLFKPVLQPQLQLQKQEATINEIKQTGNYHHVRDLQKTKKGILFQLTLFVKMQTSFNRYRVSALSVQSRIIEYLKNWGKCNTLSTFHFIDLLKQKNSKGS